MKKEPAIDTALRTLINKYLHVICLFVVLLSAVLIRAFLAPNTELSPDYNTYYKAWVDFYRSNGGLKGLEWAPGDYYVPFNVLYALSSYLPWEPWVLLSIVPCICEMVTACFIYRIIYRLTQVKFASVVAGVTTLFLPFVVFNGSLWKQVDAVYTCFLVIALYELISGNYRKSLIFYSISFAFKLQAIIFLPLFIIIYCTGGNSGSKKNFSILEFFWIPAVYLIAGLPEVLAGHGLRATYLAYFNQTGEISSEGYGMVSFFPNLYNLGFDNYDTVLTRAALLFLVAVLALILCFCVKHRDNIDENALVYLYIWTGWTCLMILPGMHERYDYAMLIMLTPFALVIRKRILWPMLMANLCSLAVYSIVLFKATEISMPVISVVYTIAYLMTTVDIVRLLGGDTGIEAKKSL